MKVNDIFCITIVVYQIYFEIGRQANNEYLNSQLITHIICINIHLFILTLFTNSYKIENIVNLYKQLNTSKLYQNFTVCRIWPKREYRTILGLIFMILIFITLNLMTNNYFSNYPKESMENIYVNVLFNFLCSY